MKIIELKLGGIAQVSSLVIVQDSSAVRHAQQVKQTAVRWQRNLSDYPCDILVPHIDSRVKLLITKGREQSEDKR
jgi:hypothetical protein